MDDDDGEPMPDEDELTWDHPWLVRRMMTYLVSCLTFDHRDLCNLPQLMYEHRDSLGGLWSKLFDAFGTPDWSTGDEFEPPKAGAENPFHKFRNAAAQSASNAAPWNADSAASRHVPRRKHELEPPS